MIEQRLAGEIPSLQSTDPNRLSKHVVLDESVSLHRAQQGQIATVRHQFDTLLAERDDLLAEVNRWRIGAGLDTRAPTYNEGATGTEKGRPNPFQEGNIHDGFVDRPMHPDRTTSDASNMNLASLGPGSGPILDPAHGLMPSNGAALWEDLTASLPIGSSALDLDGMDIGSLVPGTYELPLLRHDASQDFVIPYQPPSQILDPSIFLQDGHGHNV